MRAYQEITKLVKKFSEEKVKHVTFGEWMEYTWLILLVFLFVYDISFQLIGRLFFKVWLVLIIVIFLAFLFYIITRKVGIGITENRLIYVRVSHIGYKEKKVFEIPFEKIRFIDVRKVINSVTVKITFISDVGKLEKLRFKFSTFTMFSEDFKKNSKAIYEKLVEVQKVIDKGDF